MPPHWIFAIVIVTTSFCAAIMALTLLTVWTPRPAPPRRLAELETPIDMVVMIFEEELLIDTTPAGRALIESLPPLGSDWDRLCTHLAPRLPGFRAEMTQLARRGTLELTSDEPRPLRLRAEFVGGLARIELEDGAVEGGGRVVDGLSLAAMEDEIRQLREITEQMPIIAWREDAGGEVIWANRGYLRLCQRLLAGREGPEAQLSWPLPRLFAPQAARPAAETATGTGTGTATGTTRAEGHGTPPETTARRVRLELVPGGPLLWFDYVQAPEPQAMPDPAVPGQSARDQTTTLPPSCTRICFATPVDATVKAERALREFIQTLAKTFAHLPTGLAIFDRQRKLALFNPALVDLTTLGADFLSGRPTLFAFLDRLRESRMIPEPRNYRSWRQEMAELEKAAASGLYQDSWALPSGLTYRVTGRPHPDGAVALMIEDITAEISLTRRFRSELELGQAVVDAMSEAVAVFAPDGGLAMSNAAYARLWGSDPASSLVRVSATDALRLWQGSCAPSQVWPEARDFLARIGPREGWEVDLTTLRGEPLRCRFRAIAGGGTLVGFTRRDVARGHDAQSAEQPRSAGVTRPAAQRPAPPDSATDPRPEAGPPNRPDQGPNGSPRPRNAVRHPCTTAAEIEAKVRDKLRAIAMDQAVLRSTTSRAPLQARRAAPPWSLGENGSAGRELPRSGGEPGEG